MYKTILVAADLAKPAEARKLLEQAQKLCAPEGTIRLLHLLRGHVTAAQRASAMAGLLSLSDETDPRVMPILREGAVAPQINALAIADKADLVMLDSRLPGVTEFFMETTATKLTRHSSISVLVARNAHSERTAQHV